MYDFTLADLDGRPIQVGTRVRIWDYQPDHPDWGKHDHYTGTVTDLGDFESHIDDEGRLASSNPSVTVRFDCGDEETFATSEWEYAPVTGPDGEYWHEPEAGKVEELVAIPAADHD